MIGIMYDNTYHMLRDKHKLECPELDELSG
jgi:hypothetical protein